MKSMLLILRSATLVSFFGRSDIGYFLVSIDYLEDRSIEGIQSDLGSILNKNFQDLAKLKSNFVNL